VPLRLAAAAAFFTFFEALWRCTFFEALWRCLEEAIGLSARHQWPVLPDPDPDPGEPGGVGPPVPDAPDPMVPEPGALLSGAVPVSLSLVDPAVSAPLLVSPLPGVVLPAGLSAGWFEPPQATDAAPPSRASKTIFDRIIVYSPVRTRMRISK
jgi:hypothetical protein